MPIGMTPENVAGVTRRPSRSAMSALDTPRNVNTPQIDAVKLLDGTPFAINSFVRFGICPDLNSESARFAAKCMPVARSSELSANEACAAAPTFLFVKSARRRVFKYHGDSCIASSTSI